MYKKVEFHKVLFRIGGPDELFCVRQVITSPRCFKDPHNIYVLGGTDLGHMDCGEICQISEQYFEAVLGRYSSQMKYLSTQHGGSWSCVCVCKVCNLETYGVHPYITFSTYKLSSRYWWITLQLWMVIICELCIRKTCEFDTYGVHPSTTLSANPKIIHYDMHGL